MSTPSGRPNEMTAYRGLPPIAATSLTFTARALYPRSRGDEVLRRKWTPSTIMSTVMIPWCGPNSTTAASSPGPNHTPGASSRRSLLIAETRSSSVKGLSPSFIMRGYRTARRLTRATGGGTGAVGRGAARRRHMAVINTIELEGVSERSWGEAAREALREAAKTIRGINRLEVISTSTTIRNARIADYCTHVRLYFTVESSL